jgi:hypothetical protein
MAILDYFVQPAPDGLASWPLRAFPQSRVGSRA